MKHGTKLLVGIGLTAAMLFAGHQAEARRRAKKEYAGLVLGFEGKKVEWGFCTDKRTESEARSCAMNKFHANGGHRNPKTWTWSCKGYWAVATSDNGNAASVRSCLPSLADAKAAAKEACEENSAQSCAVRKSGSDRS